MVNLPDFIVNCGGLVGCLLEWAWREELLGDPGERPRVDAIARRFIARIVEGNVRALLSTPRPPRTAADQIAGDAHARIHALWSRQPAGDGRARVRSYLETVLALD